jgi:hypothetical protein
MSQDTTNDDKAKKLANSSAARGYVATQQSLYGLVNDLLATVKGIRKQQKEQHEKIEELTKLVNQQKEELDRLRRQQQSNGASVSTVSTPSTATAAASSANPDLSQFRRELVGIIGEALAQHEEEHHEHHPTIAPSNTTEPSHKITTTTTNHEPPWLEFRSKILPRYLTRTFYATGTTLLQGPACSYIDYPMSMALAELQPSQLPTCYSWSFQTEGPHWAVGMAVLSKTKWESPEDKVLGDGKGEWAFRSDSTLWSHTKFRQNLTPPIHNDESTLITLTLELHPPTRVVLKGSTAKQASSSVWFDIPWKNFKKPAVFVPAATVQTDSVVRFRGWES